MMVFANHDNTKSYSLEQANVLIADNSENIETGVAGSYFSSLEWLTGKDAPEKPLFRSNTLTTDYSSSQNDVFSDEPVNSSVKRSKHFLTWHVVIVILGSVSFLVAFGIGFSTGRAQNIPRGHTEPVEVSTPTTSPATGPNENNAFSPTEPQQNDSTNNGDNSLDNPGSNVTSGTEDFNKSPIDSVTVGVYYYPWYINDDFNGREYIRRELEPPQYPVLGEYNLQDSDAISQHLKWTSGANINLWVTSWSGPYSATDLVTRNGILVNKELGDTKIALFYETYSQIPKDTTNIDVVYGDIAYAARTYFDHPNYLKIDGRPVLFVYVARALSRKGILDDVVNDMKRAARDNGGHSIYIVGDHAFGKPPTEYYPPFDLIDAATNYDVYGSMDKPRYAGEEGVEKYKLQQMGWRDTALRQGCGFIPSISPGYNDRGVRLGANHPAMSRRITDDAPVGSLFKAQLSNALNLLDENAANILMINSFNEWHEDTQIEPVVDVGVTTKPFELTQNLEYTAYGELFLDLVREGTTLYEEALSKKGT